MISMGYVISDYNKNTAEHLLHVYDFLHLLSQKVNLFLYVERSDGAPEFPSHVRVYRQRTRHILPGMVERAVIFMLWRLMGCRVFYVHVSYLSGCMAAMITRITGGRSYYWFCERYVNYGMGHSAGRLDWLRWKLKDDIPFRLCLTLSHHVVTGCRSVGESFTKWFGTPTKKIIIIPNSIHVTHFRDRSHGEDEFQSESSGKKRIVFIHWLAKRKGVYQIPEIIQRVRSSFQDVHFDIVGGGPLENWLRNEVVKLHLNDRVTFHGLVPNRHIPKILKSSNVFIMPSEQEGFPRVVLEAMALQVPMVLTDSGCVREIFKDISEQPIVACGDIAEFSRSIVMLIENTALRDLLKRAYERNVKRYDLSVVMEDFIKVMERSN